MLGRPGQGVRPRQARRGPAARLTLIVQVADRSKLLGEISRVRPVDHNELLRHFPFSPFAVLTETSTASPSLVMSHRALPSPAWSRLDHRPSHTRPSHAASDPAQPGHASTASPCRTEPRHAMSGRSTPRPPSHALPRLVSPDPAMPCPALPHLDRPASPHQAVPGLAQPSRTLPHRHDRQALPRPAPPGRAAPRHAAPGLALPRHTLPRPPCHALPSLTQPASPDRATPRPAATALPGPCLAEPGRAEPNPRLTIDRLTVTTRPLHEAPCGGTSNPGSVRTEASLRKSLA